MPPFVSVHTFCASWIWSRDSHISQGIGLLHWNPHLTKCQGTGKLVRYIKGRFISGCFTHIYYYSAEEYRLLQRTLLYRGLLNRGSTVIQRYLYAVYEDVAKADLGEC